MRGRWLQHMSTAHHTVGGGPVAGRCKLDPVGRVPRMLLCDALCCCSCLCCCWRWEGSVKTKYAIAKWLYFAGWTGTLIGTWLLRDYASQQFADSVGEVAAYCGSAPPEEQASCAGGQIAMRISFANFVFFSLHAVIMLGLTHEGDIRLDVQSSGWVFKAMLWAGLLIAFFFVPATAINGYAQFARVGSGIFLVLQLLLLIDVIYRISEFLTEADTWPAWALLVTGAAISFSIGLVGIGFAYHWYTASPTCSLNIFFCTWSIIIGILLVVVLFIPNRAPTAGLLTSGLVFLYCTFLLLGAFSSEPPGSFPQCSNGSGANPRWLQIIGFFLALATVMYSTMTAGVAHRDFFGVKQPEDDGLSSHLPYRPDFFHMIFALASLYIAMLFSNWEVSSSSSSFEIDTGWISTWVKMGSKWTCEVLYLWSVVAPALFPNRDFGVA